MLKARTEPIARASSPESSGGAKPEAPTISAPAWTAAESLSSRVWAATAAIRAASSGSVTGRSTNTVEMRLPVSPSDGPDGRTLTGTSATARAG